MDTFGNVASFVYFLTTTKNQTNFDKIVIGWSSSKIVSGSHALPPRWPPQCSCIVIESSFDPGERLQAPGSFLFYFLFKFHVFFISSDPNGSWSSFVVGVVICQCPQHSFLKKKTGPLEPHFIGNFQLMVRCPLPNLCCFFYQHYAQQKHETLIKGCLLFFCMQHLLFNWCWRFLYPRNEVVRDILVSQCPSVCFCVCRQILCRTITWIVFLKIF